MDIPIAPGDHDPLTRTALLAIIEAALRYRLSLPQIGKHMAHIIMDTMHVTDPDSKATKVTQIARVAQNELLAGLLRNAIQGHPDAQEEDSRL